MDLSWATGEAEGEAVGKSSKPLEVAASGTSKSSNTKNYNKKQIFNWQRTASIEERGNRKKRKEKKEKRARRRPKGPALPRPKEDRQKSKYF